MIQMYEVNNLLASCSEQKRSFAQRSRNCFARVDFRCGVLKETLCKKGLCPFYKSKQQYKEDIEKYPHRDGVARKEKGGSSDG